MTVTVSDRLAKEHARFVFRFVIISMIPAFAGFVVGFSEESAVIVLGVGVAVITVDVLMMMLLRRRRRSLEAESSDGGLIDAHARPVMLGLALLGISATVVALVMQLDEAASALRVVAGVVAAILLLTAGSLALRAERK